MQIVEQKVVLTKRQRLAWSALHNDDVKEILYGGAKGGGKSWLLCIWAFNYACWVIDHFGLRDSKEAIAKYTANPIHVGWIGRKQSVDFTGTTLDTWRREIPADRYELKGSSDKDNKHILIDGVVAVDYGGLDKSSSVNKFNSAEYAFFGLDQAEETSKDDIAVLRASRRLKINGEKLPYKGFYTANPAQCYLKHEFILHPKKNFRFIQALPADNPHLPDDYIQMLQDAFEHRPELLDAYLKGLWDAFEGHDQVIKSAWLQEAKQRSYIWPVIKHYLVCDPARFGDDTTVILRMINSEIKEKVVLPYCRTTQISQKLAAMSVQNGGLTCVVETTGGDIGAGVVDELHQMEIPVLVFTPQGAATKTIMVKAKDSGKPVMKEVYGNLRAEAWANAGKKLSSGMLDQEHNVPLVTRNMYERLETQLCYPRYKFKGGKTLIESKEDLKKPERLGESPDDADTYVIALWAWDKIDPVVDKEDQVRYREPTEARSPMRM